jgi:nitrate/nitrite-specific signal transduction histidine kinase
MAINRRRFLALPGIGVLAMVVGKRMGMLAWLKSYFSAHRGVSLTAESVDERARYARELHESALQSLIAMEMQVDVLRRQALAQANPLASELGRMQGNIREEVLKHRELMQQMNQQMNPLDSSTFIPFLKDTVERFQRETGISARLMSELDEVKMPPQVCRALVRIIQERLVRVRSFDVTKHVLVRLTTTDSHWQVTVEDDGRGFPFSGRRSQADLEKMGYGRPMVILEQVRLIGGELTAESNPGRGSRLLVTVPQRLS